MPPAVPLPPNALDGWGLVDLRSPAAYRRGHLRGALSLPARDLGRSTFLLPPRREPVAFLHSDAAIARTAAEVFAARGWPRVGWLDGDAADLEPGVTGPESVTLWKPSPWLSAQAPYLRRLVARARRAGRRPRGLDLACGSGRNSVFLARLGFDAVGVDLLGEAIVQARRLARTSGFRAPPVRHAEPARGSARFHRGDLTDPSAQRRWLSSAAWDAILCFRYLDRAILPLMERSLAPRGLLCMETFLEEQARIHGRPRRRAFLLAPGELTRAFPSLEILAAREGADEEDNRLASILARAPNRGVSGSARGVPSRPSPRSSSPSSPRSRQPSNL